VCLLGLECWGRVRSGVCARRGGVGWVCLAAGGLVGSAGAAGAQVAAGAAGGGAAYA
jgi:hypothetical protein